MDNPEPPRSNPPKPIAKVVRPEITRLPTLNLGRRIARLLLWWLARFLIWLFVRAEIHGQEHAPSDAALVVSNHLGAADLILGLATSRRLPEIIAKAELRDLPIVGLLMRAYGVIWVHRGQPDRRALRAALQGLAEGRIVCIAPEGRESVTGALEEATQGAAFLAIKSGAPILPVTFTGTEDQSVLGSLKRLRRAPVCMTAGAPFHLERSTAAEHRALRHATRQIMQALAGQLPARYRGVYAGVVQEESPAVKNTASVQNTASAPASQPPESQ